MTKKKPLAATYYVNRGTKQEPYGFVYFTDDTRVGFAPGTRDTLGPYGLFPGDWGSVTFEHLVLAEELLARNVTPQSTSNCHTLTLGDKSITFYLFPITSDTHLVYAHGIVPFVTTGIEEAREQLKTIYSKKAL